MKPAVLLHFDGNWLLFEGDRARAVAEYPDLETATIVLTDFDGAISGISVIDGNQRHAEALISRHLRDDGLVDDETRILIHHGARIAEGYQVLYSAIRMAVWQRMLHWAGSQKEHCLVIPQTALMHKLLSQDHEGVIFHCGKKISFLGRKQKVLSYFSVMTLGKTGENQQVSIKTLADWVRQNGAAGAGRAAGKIDWYYLDASADGAKGENSENSENSLIEYFSRQSGIRAVGVETESCKEGGTDYRIRRLLRALQAVLSEKIAINPPFARLACLAEKNIAPFGYGIGVMAIALLVWSAVLLYQANDIHEKSAELRAETQRIMQGGHENTLMPPAGSFFATRDFVDLVVTTQAELEPYAFLKYLRMIAGTEIELLRIHIQPEEAHIVIEGWINKKDGSDQLLADFLTRLRQQGFSTEAVGSSLGALTPPGGSFAYRLQSIAVQKGDGI
jgi:hypothetical protein